MKRKMVALAVLGGWMMTAPARADEASKRAKVEELFSVLRINRITEQITASMHKQMEASLRNLPGSATMTPEQKRIVDDYQGKVGALVNETVSWKLLEPQMVELYSTTYSEGEIDGILAFYKSPVGQSMLAKTPELTQKSLQITQTKLATLQPKIGELSQEFVRQYTAAQAPPPAGATPGKTPAAAGGSGTGSGTGSGAGSGSGTGKPTPKP